MTLYKYGKLVKLAKRFKVAFITSLKHMILCKNKKKREGRMNHFNKNWFLICALYGLPKLGMAYKKIRYLCYGILTA